MGCNPDDILSYLDGEMTPEEARRVRAHTSACAACRDLLLSEQELATDLGGLRDFQMPADFAQATVRKAQCDVRHSIRSAREWRRIAAITAFLSVAAFMLLWPTGAVTSGLAHLAPLRCLTYFAADWVANTALSTIIVSRTLSRSLFEESSLSVVTAPVLVGLLLAILVLLRSEYLHTAASHRDAPK